MTTDRRRVEVVGRQRRRRYTIEEKCQIVSETLRPGSSIGSVSHKYDLAPRLLYTWRSRLKKSGHLTRSPLEIAVVPAAAPASVKPPHSGFVHVATVREEQTNSIRVRVGNDVFAEFPTDIDPRRLAAIVQALRG